MKNIKEKVLKEGDKKWDIFWEFNRDRIDEDGDKFIELDNSVISKVSFIVGFEKAIDPTLAEVGKVVDDFENDILRERLSHLSTETQDLFKEDIKELKQKLGIK